jgi:hypothetical protein
MVNTKKLMNSVRTVILFISKIEVQVEFFSVLSSSVKITAGGVNMPWAVSRASSAVSPTTKVDGLMVFRFPILPKEVPNPIPVR